MGYTPATTRAIAKYGEATCKAAYEYNQQGYGARSIWQECISGIENTRACDAAINAGREIASGPIAPKLTFLEATRTAQETHHAVIQRKDGEYRVRLNEWLWNHEAVYFTNDLQDALDTAIAMRAHERATFHGDIAAYRMQTCTRFDNTHHEARNHAEDAAKAAFTARPDLRVSEDVPAPAERVESAWSRDARLVREAIAAFPETFTLRAPHEKNGEKFRISPQASYVNDSGDVQLVVEIGQFNDEREYVWLQYAKVSIAELSDFAQALPTSYSRMCDSFRNDDTHAVAVVTATREQRPLSLIGEDCDTHRTYTMHGNKGAFPITWLRESGLVDGNGVCVGADESYVAQLAREAAIVAAFDEAYAMDQAREALAYCPSCGAGAVEVEEGKVKCSECGCECGLIPAEDEEADEPRASTMDTWDKFRESPKDAPEAAALVLRAAADYIYEQSANDDALDLLDAHRKLTFDLDGDAPKATGEHDPDAVPTENDIRTYFGDESASKGQAALARVVKKMQAKGFDVIVEHPTPEAVAEREERARHPYSHAEHARAILSARLAVPVKHLSNEGLRARKGYMLGIIAGTSAMVGGQSVLDDATRAYDEACTWLSCYPDSPHMR